MHSVELYFCLYLHLLMHSTCILGKKYCSIYVVNMYIHYGCLVTDIQFSITLLYGENFELQLVPLYDGGGRVWALGEVALFERLRLVPLRDEAGRIFALGQVPN